MFCTLDTEVLECDLSTLDMQRLTIRQSECLKSMH